MKKKSLFIIPLSLIAAILGIAALYIITLTIIEYRPKAVEERPFTSGNEKLEKNTQYSILSWNIGYAGLGKDEDFFMDGGKEVRPSSKKTVEGYLSGIITSINNLDSDLLIIQEIDVNSKRSWYINEFDVIKAEIQKGAAFACNYKCVFVPIPLPPIGRVEAGLSTFTNYQTTSAQRIALPVPFKWPVRLVNLKRCILSTRIPVYQNGIPTGKELVLANFHLEAYDNGEGKIAQTKALKEFIENEYKKGNYVIAGGDFNQKFPGSQAFPVIDENGWIPGEMDAAMLEKDWQFVFDDSKPSCRSDIAPYNDEKAKAHNWQYYIIDGFIISPNVKNINTQVIDLDFQDSDHNPIQMIFELD